MTSDGDSEDGSNRASTPLELFHGLHIDVTLLFFHTAMNKLVVGGHKANKMATDCTTVELLCTGLTLVLVFLVILFRHVLPGVVDGPFRWRVVRCFFVESALMSFHYRPISCLVAANYFYAFSLVQGVAQAILFIIATILFAKHIHWRSIFLDDFDMPSEVSLAGDVPSMSWNGLHQRTADGSTSRAAQGSTTATRVAPVTTRVTPVTSRVATVTSMEPECLECHVKPCRCHQMREREQDLVAQARKLGMSGVVRANPNAADQSLDDDDDDLEVEDRERHNVWQVASSQSRAASRKASDQSREPSTSRPGSRNASQPTSHFWHGRGKVAPSDVGAVDELDF